MAERRGDGLLSGTRLVEWPRIFLRGPRGFPKLHTQRTALPEAPVPTWCSALTGPHLSPTQGGKVFARDRLGHGGHER